jgi:hypothetical protein
MPLPILYTDPNCALCKSFSKKIKAKIADRLELREIEEGQDLKYINDDVEYLGIEATQKLVEDFPELKEFLWLLPQSLREEALIKGYKWSSFLRKILFRRSCEVCPK